MATHPRVLAGESQGRGSLVGFRLWVAQSRTRLQRLSSSSSKPKQPRSRTICDDDKAMMTAVVTGAVMTAVTTANRRMGRVSW